MTFPVVESFVFGDAFGTSYPFTLPSGIVAGDLLVSFITLHMTGPDNPLSWPAGWTPLAETFYGTVDGRGYVGYRIADGSEGATFTPTSTLGGRAVHHGYRLSHYSGVPVAAVVHQGFANPDPPALTSGFGAVDTLWLAVAWFGNVSVDLTGYPAGYTNGVFTRSAGTNPGMLATARKASTAASEDPGPFTLTFAPWASAGTIAIKGGAGTTPPPVSGGKGQWFWRVVQPGDGPTVEGIRDAAGLMGLAHLMELSGAERVLSGPSASADTTSPFSIPVTPTVGGRMMGGIVYAHDDSLDGDALAPLTRNVEVWEDVDGAGPTASVVYFDSLAAGTFTVGESAIGAVPGGAGVQTLLLDGPVTPTLILQTRVLTAVRDTLLQLTPGKSKRGAGHALTLPVGVYNDYHYRAAIRFPAIDWTNVKRVRSARLILRRSDQRLVAFGRYPTIYVRRSIRDWPEGTSVSPSIHNASVWSSSGTTTAGQVKANLAGGHAYENKYRYIPVTNIVRAWAPPSAGGAGLRDYGFMVLPYTGKEIDTTEFWSRERSSTSGPRLELQLEVNV